MRKVFSFIDYFFIVIALVSLYLGIQTMLKTPTLILSSWFLVMLFGGILLLTAFIIGALINSLTRSKIRILTAASVIVTIICLTFYINEFRPTYKIYVPDNFKGQVRLFRSRLNDNRLTLNQYGVGYITEKAYRKGFKHIVYQSGKNITDMCKDIAQGSETTASVNGRSLGPFYYVGFTIKYNAADTIWNDLKKVIEQQIIDTSIIKK